MAIQTNLSKKDKLTIAVLLYGALLFMIIWFLIRPTVTSIMTINDKIEDAKLKQTQYRTKIMYLASAEDLYSRAVIDLTESTQDYYPEMDSAEIDRMVTSYVLKSGLFSESLSIRMPDGPVSESPYTYSSIKVNQNTAIVSSDNSSDEAETLLVPYNNARYSSTSTQSSDVKCVKLTLVVSGSRNACQAFIDDICTKPAIRITGFEWDRPQMIKTVNEETGVTEYVESKTIRLKVNVNLYMVDVADYGAAVSNADT